MQPGQMAYDRGITVFSPDGRLFQVEYAREAVKKGTTTIGLKFKDGVILIVDKRVSSRLIEPDSIEKIYNIDEYIGCATSGLVADARVLVDQARKDAQTHKITFNENDLVGSTEDLGCTVLDRPFLFDIELYRGLFLGCGNVVDDFLCVHAITSLIV